MNYRRFQDILAARIMMILSVLSGLIVLVMIGGLYVKSRPILADRSLGELLLGTTWRPSAGKFGFLPYLAGTLWVTALAVAFAIPLCLLVAIYLSEYAHRRVRQWIMPLVDLLAGIPSVVFGLWGVFTVVPLIKDKLAPVLGISSTGYCVLSGGIVLAIMIFPILINVSLEVFRAVPGEMRQAALCLGATRWQMVKSVVMRRSLPGIIAACVLGLSRAFGETMAVLMVVGNVPIIPRSPFDPAYPLPALIANHYGEMVSIPLYDSALLLAALVLMAVVLFFNLLARVILIRVEKVTQ